MLVIIRYCDNKCTTKCNPTTLNLQICSVHWKWLFFPEKALQTTSKSAYKCRRNLLLKYASSSAAETWLSKCQVTLGIGLEDSGQMDRLLYCRVLVIG